METRASQSHPGAPPDPERKPTLADGYEAIARALYEALDVGPMTVLMAHVWCYEEFGVWVPTDEIDALFLTWSLSGDATYTPREGARWASVAKQV